MSGIAGIVYNDGRPVNMQLLRQMTRSLSFRGPDAQETWAYGSAGLGHALLRTTQEERREHQPASLDQQTWIVADARLDAREDLVQALRARGREVCALTPDCELLLHAYAEWDEACVEHILGDYAFAIWYGRRRQLFCACDPFGIKALYFAERGNCLVFSNTLECVRLHPEVSDRLNDAAIADFLLFGLNYDAGTTSFADIRRLPPAHVLRWSSEGLQLRRYWMPPTDGCIRYRRRAEYVEHFGELLKKAVEDRLPRDRAGILLSGGLDSSSVAATARDLQEEKFPTLELHAFTTTCEKLIKDNETPAARITAEALHLIPHSTAIDSHGIFGQWATAGVHWPEPMESPFAGSISDEFRAMAEHVRVALSGEGSDNLMEFEMGEHVRGLWQQGQVGRLILDLAGHIVHRFRAPDGIRGPLRRIGRMGSQRKTRAPIPPWLTSDLVAQLNLESRWENPLPEIPWNSHPVHPKAYGSLFLPQWTCLFEQDNPGVTWQPVEVRYPFLDLRLVDFLLGIPTMPWFFRKHILREAMRGRLPEEIRMRPKRPLRDDPIVAALRESGAKRVEQVRPTEELHRFVTLQRFASPLEESDPEQMILKLRPLCLAYWLQSLREIGYKMPAGAGHAKAAGVNG